MDLIRIKALQFDCIVGVRPDEREREQRIELEIALAMDLSAAGRTGRIALTCDYDQIATEIIALLRFRRYHLIEMATEELAAMLLAVHPAVQRVELHLDKPGALDGRARAASVEVTRERSAYPFETCAEPFGESTLVLGTRDARLELLRLAPRSASRWSPEPGQLALEWLIEGDLERGGARVRPHDPEQLAPEAEPSAYGTEAGALLFRCIGPAGGAE